MYKIDKKVDLKDDIQKLTFNLYSKLSFEAAGEKEIYKIFIVIEIDNNLYDNFYLNCKIILFYNKIFI